MKGNTLTLHQFVLHFRCGVHQILVKNEQLTTIAVLSKPDPLKPGLSKVYKLSWCLTYIQLAHILRLCTRSEHNRKRLFVGKTPNPCHYSSSGTVHVPKTHSLCHGPGYCCAKHVQMQKLPAQNAVNSSVLHFLVPLLQKWWWRGQFLQHTNW